MSFADFIGTFLDNLLPIMLISGVGFILGKLLAVDSRSIGRVLFYIFSPILIFNLLYTTELPFGEILETMGFTASVIAAVGGVTLAIGWVFRLPRATLMAVLLTSMFANTGNYGLPLVSFAFGKNAAAHASLYFVSTTVLFNSLGVLIASLGHLRLRDAFLALLKVPTVYAGLLGLLLNQMHIRLSLPLDRSVQLAAGGTIPLMIILLGLELSHVQWSDSLRLVGVSTGLRLLVGPLVGLTLAGMFGLTLPARQGDIVQASMPSAVSCTMLATEYNLEPRLVTSIVFVSTLLSPLTLTPLLVFLGR
jgi:predicted permease